MPNLEILEEFTANNHRGEVNTQTRRRLMEFASYLSFCLWMSLRSGLCCLGWPHPVCDARLGLALWLEVCLWGKRGKGSVLCPESNVFSPIAAVHLQTESVKILESLTAEIIKKNIWI